jgi:hypothetical protein
LYDSCFVPKSMFKAELDRIRNLHPTCHLWARSDRSLRREWAAHNWAYALGIKRDKTADVDLNFEQSWYTRLGYCILGSIAMLFIK